jgi:hypothetical protein
MANAKVNAQKVATGRVGGTNAPVYALKMHQVNHVVKLINHKLHLK